MWIVVVGSLFLLWIIVAAMLNSRIPICFTLEKKESEEACAAEVLSAKCKYSKFCASTTIKSKKGKK